MDDEDNIISSTAFKSVEELAKSFREELNTVCLRPRNNYRHMAYRWYMAEEYINDLGDFEDLTDEEILIACNNIDRILKGKVKMIKIDLGGGE